MAAVNVVWINWILLLECILSIPGFIRYGFRLKMGYLINSLKLICSIEIEIRASDLKCFYTV